MSDSLRKITHGNISTYTETNNSFLEDIYSQLLIGLNIIGSRLGTAIDTISNTADFISYPILLLLLGFLVYSNSLIKTKSNNTTLVELILVFGFFWLILSAGIIWYGYLMFPLILISMVTVIKTESNKILKYLGFAILTAWVVIAIVARISFIGISSNFNSDSAGKSIVNTTMIQRSLNLNSTDEIYDKVHPGLVSTMKIINQNKSGLILMIGTTLGYFMENGEQRIIHDNQIGFTDLFTRIYKTQEDITIALRYANIKYIFFDLNTATLDRTPEKTLTSKFNRLVNYLENNEEIKLLATDRIIKPSTPTSSNYKYGFSGLIHYSGSYAIFEII